MPNTKIKFRPSYVAGKLAATAFFLVVLEILIEAIYSVNFNGQGNIFADLIVSLFDLDAELNVPTFFSSVLLAFTASILFLIGFLNRQNGEAHVSKWLTLSWLFVWLSFDEITQMHEKLNRPVKVIFDNQEPSIFYFAWVVPALVLLPFLGLFFRDFLMHLHRRDRRRFLIASALYVGGALGAELVGGHYAGRYGQESQIYGIVTTFEESLEMAGIIFFIWALLKYCEEQFKEILIDFEDM